MGKNVIPSDSAAQLAATLSTLDQKAIIRPDNPPRGIAGFLFDIRGEESIELTSEITDEYVEDNTAVADQIALKPEIVTVRGMIAELTDASYTVDPLNPPTNPLPTNTVMMPQPSPGTLTALVKTVLTRDVQSAALQVLSGTNPNDAIRGVVATAKAQTVAGLTNKFTNTASMAIRTLLDPNNAAALVTPMMALPLVAQTAVNAIKSLIPNELGTVLGALRTPTTPASQNILTGDNAANSDDYQSLFEAYKAKQPTPPKDTRQTSGFLYFYGLWKSRTLFSVETAWGIFNSMAILSMKASQSEDTKDASDFTITFKKFRTVGNVQITEGQLAGRAVAQNAASAPANNGSVGQTPLNDTQKMTYLRRFAEVVVGVTP